MRLTNSFDGGTPGVAITTDNSGDSGTAFTFVDDQDPAYYSSTRAAHGSLSAEARADTWPLVAWNYLLSGNGDIWAGAYVYLEPTPDYAEFQIVLATVDFATLWQAILYADGDGSTGLYVAHLAGDEGQMVAMVYDAEPALNQWIRVEFRANNAANGSAEIRLYNDAESLTPDAIASGVVTQPVVPWESVMFAAQTWGSRMWFDEVVATDEGWPGPVGGGPPAAVPFHGWGIPIGSASRP